MFKGKSIKRLLATMLACSMLLATNMVAFAGRAYDEAFGQAGSTGVTAEVGFNGQTAYAKVTATDYVDARMNGNVYYNGASGPVVLSGAFDQRTYGEVSQKCTGDVYVADCYFYVTSADGEWSFYGYAQ